MSRGLARRSGFDVRTALSPDELWERLLGHDKIREANEPAPSPAPPVGAPFLVARQAEHEVRLRHWAGPADAVSPVIVLRLRPDDRGGTIVEGRFERRGRTRQLVDLPRLRPTARRWAWAGAGVSLLGAALLAPVLLGASVQAIASVLVLLVLFTIPTALVFVPGMLIWQSEGRKRFIPALWELVGEVFTPIALPAAATDDAPFRGRALPTAKR